MVIENKFQRDIKDAITRRDLFKTMAALTTIALLPTPILALAQLPNPQNYSGLEVNTKIKEVKLMNNDLLFVDSIVTVYKDGSKINSGEIIAYALRTAPSIVVPPSMVIIYDKNNTIGIVVSYENYIKVQLPPDTPSHVVINELIKKASDNGMSDVVRTIDIITGLINASP